MCRRGLHATTHALPSHPSWQPLSPTPPPSLAPPPPPPATVPAPAPCHAALTPNRGRFRCSARSARPTAAAARCWSSATMLATAARACRQGPRLACLHLSLAAPQPCPAPAATPLPHSLPSRPRQAASLCYTARLTTPRTTPGCEGGSLIPWVQPIVAPRAALPRLCLPLGRWTPTAGPSRCRCPRCQARAPGDTWGVPTAAFRLVCSLCAWLWLPISERERYHSTCRVAMHEGQGRPGA